MRIILPRMLNFYLRQWALDRVAHVVLQIKTMVFTRSKARQKALEGAQQDEAETDTSEVAVKPAESSVRSVRKARRSTVHVSTTEQTSDEGDIKEGGSLDDLALTTEQTSEGDIKEGGSLDDLALRALRVMKERLGLLGDDQTGMESSDDTQPDVILLESDSSSKKKRSAPVKQRRPDDLATTLKPRMKEKPYFSYSRKRGVSHSAGKPVAWGEGEEEVMKKSVITSDFEKRDVAPPMYVSKFAKARARKEAREKSTGRGWYEMSAPQMTTELQNDLKLLRMRNALNPSQHYKSSDWKKLPRYFQVGKVVSGPAEFYSGRIPKRKRKQTIMDELLHNHQFRRYQKRKYSELQRKFRSGTTRRKRFIKHRKHYKK